MHFKKIIEELAQDKKVILYVDMDGVITDYNAMGELNFKEKRPLKSNIKKLEMISKINNVEIRILSICRTIDQIDDKNKWLDKYAKYFADSNRNIIAKELYPNKKSKELKLEFLEKEVIKNKNDYTILLDDDNQILKEIKENNPSILIFQDSVLID